MASWHDVRSIAASLPGSEERHARAPTSLAATFRPRREG